MGSETVTSGPKDNMRVSLLLLLLSSACAFVTRPLVVTYLPTPTAEKVVALQLHPAVELARKVLVLPIKVSVLRTAAVAVMAQWTWLALTSVSDMKKYPKRILAKSRNDTPEGAPSSNLKKASKQTFSIPRVPKRTSLLLFTTPSNASERLTARVLGSMAILSVLRALDFSTRSVYVEGKILV